MDLKFSYIISTGPKVADGQCYGTLDSSFQHFGFVQVLASLYFGEGGGLKPHQHSQVHGYMNVLQMKIEIMHFFLDLAEVRNSRVI